MNKQLTFKLSLVMAGLLALPLAQAAGMSKADYNTAKTRISADYKAGRNACDAQAANAKDVCVEEAGARQKVALAELEYGYSGKPVDQTKLKVAKAESAYSVAKEKCDDQAGNAKDVCVQEAKAVETKALADAKMGQQIGEAKTDASVAKRDADYQVAVEKCDAMAGDAKASCLSAAKLSFGKS
jgi:exoribonuclease II